MAIGLMIAIGIGLHNFGEGLAIGSAVGLGQVAFIFLIVGFTLHNATEGLCYCSTYGQRKTHDRKTCDNGIIAGSPAIFGAWLGGFAYSPFTAVVFLSIGAGAIFQVVIIIIKWLQEEGNKQFSSAAVLAGISVGMIVMYLTSILI